MLFEGKWQKERGPDDGYFMGRRGGGVTLLEDSDPSAVRPSDRSTMKLHLVARNEDCGVLGPWLMLNNSELGF